MGDQMNPLVLNLALAAGMILFMYFILIRPQKKREAQINEMRASLKVGDEIVTIGGIRGKIVLVKEDILVIESGSAKTKLETTKWAVSSKIS